MTFAQVSLFTGVGGLDLGFEHAGFESVLQCEIDKQAVSVLERWWPAIEMLVTSSILSTSGHQRTPKVPNDPAKIKPADLGTHNFKPTKLPSLVPGATIYSGACPNCSGDIEVNFMEKRLVCLACARGTV